MPVDTIENHPCESEDKSPVPSGCNLALHVDVFTAGSCTPGPLIKLKGVLGLRCSLT